MAERTSPSITALRKVHLETSWWHLLQKEFVTWPLLKMNPKALAVLKKKFPNAQYRQMVDLIQQNALYIFTQDWKKLNKIKLHLKGTRFN